MGFDGESPMLLSDVLHRSANLHTAASNSTFWKNLWLLSHAGHVSTVFFFSAVVATVVYMGINPRSASQMFTDADLAFAMCIGTLICDTWARKSAVLLDKINESIAIIEVLEKEQDLQPRISTMSLLYWATCSEPFLVGLGFCVMSLATGAHIVPALSQIVLHPWWGLITNCLLCLEVYQASVSVMGLINLLGGIVVSCNCAFHLLGLRLENVRNGDLLRDVILVHQKLLQMMGSLGESLSMPFFFFLAIGNGALALACVSIVAGTFNFVLLMTSLFVITSMTIASHAGDSVEEASLSLQDSAYTCLVHLSASERKDLLMLIRRSQKPVVLRAKWVGALSHFKYRQMIRSLYSYTQLLLGANNNSLK